MKRVKLLFVRGLEVFFVDRDKAIKQIEDIGVRGTRFPLIIYGPEGCGKTALLRQAAVLLNDMEYHVIYINPVEGVLDRALWCSPTIRDIVEEILRAIGGSIYKLVEAVLRITDLVLRRFRRARIALLLDDVFQALGLDRVEVYVKSLLNLIEYPPMEYENIVVMVTSSEGLSRSRIGRHRWARITAIWNMDRAGFEELYNQLSGDKPSIDDVWLYTGGNPSMLAQLYEAHWSDVKVVDQLIRERRLSYFMKTLSRREQELLYEAVEDPDTLWIHLEDPRAQKLLNRLIEMNMVVELWDRSEDAWIDIPPPEKDLSIGVGRYIAWQTPLHREAIRKVLLSSSV